MRKQCTIVQGARFGRWTVIGEHPERDDQRRRRWQCRCDCGTTRMVLNFNLIGGQSRSCGCLQAEIVTVHNTKHGQSHSPEHRAWRGMLDRCHVPSNGNYPRYGGRGITVCTAWQSFDRFYADVGPRPSPAHSLDRINNNLGYFPENVRWATRTEQANNRRNNRMLTFNGITQSATEWARSLGMRDNSAILERLRMGWSLERALTTPLQDRLLNLRH